MAAQGTTHEESIPQIFRVAHRYTRLQVLATCIALSGVWLGVFYAVGVTCPRSSSKHLARATQTGKPSAAEAGKPQAAKEPRTGAARQGSNKKAQSCFGFHWSGIVTVDTLIWLAATFFPATAILYSIFHLVARLREIEHAADVRKLYYLYAKSGTTDEKKAWEDFQDYSRARFWEYNNPWELAAFALGVGVLVVILAKLVILSVAAEKAGSYLNPPLDSKDLPIAFTIGAGLLGSTIGSMLFVLRRYRTFNIYSFTYFQAFVAVAAGTFSGAFWHFVLAANVSIFLAFGIGFLTALNVDYMVSLLRPLIAKLTSEPEAPSPKSDLDLVILNPDAIDVLMTMSVFSIAEFINTDPMRLYLNLPQSMGTIDGWMDLALLRFHFPDPKQVDSLAMAGVRQFSQLFNRFADQITKLEEPYPRAEVKWRLLDHAQVIGANMDYIFATIDDIVKSGRYDRQLAVISEAFRAKRFPPTERGKGLTFNI